MKVVHFAEYASGGVATYIKNLVNSQVSNSNISKVIIYCSKNHSDFDILKFRDEKVKVISYPYRRGFIGIFKILGMKKKIMSSNPDVIHIHSTFAGLIRFSFMFSKKKNKLLYCAHGWSFNKESSKFLLTFYRIIEKILSNFCYKIINISNYDSKSASFIGQNKMVTIRNSIPDLVVQKDKGSTNGKYRKILFVGRLDFQKGIDILISVVNKYFDGENIRLTVVGDAIIDDSLSIKTENTDNIKFVGWKSQSDVLHLLSDTDALVMPSRWEGLPITALEAMRESKMIISSDADAIPEVVINNYNGILFHKGSESSLSKAISRFLVMSSKDINKFGENGRHEYLTNFSYSQMLAKINELYLEVAEK
ncbi:glycosyltransferase [Pediococcus ethanolidurans]|uniref:glycosyltransferase n=1 Tax=Pediococcus ethanolidurans TaxID=319653 RepID=UPI0021E8F086|nr:glycosyltransferase [Pediococcus ethanolidurans]MCV3322377.1 glycosyltransferase [Pediococcus ethanolidurans]